MLPRVESGSWVLLAVVSMSCRFADPPFVPDEDDFVVLFKDVCSHRPYSCSCTNQQVTDESCGVASDPWFAAAGRLGLTYDSDCATEVLNEWGQLSLTCEPESEDSRSWLPCDDECQVYFGEAGLSETCERAGRRMSTCTQGLICGVDDRCHAPCDAPSTIPAGHACGYAAGYGTESCAAGTICAGDPETCIVPLARGASCTDRPGSTCGSEDRCDAGTGTCAAKFAEGAPCSSGDDCISGACSDQCVPPEAFECDHFLW